MKTLAHSHKEQGKDTLPAWVEKSIIEQARGHNLPSKGGSANSTAEPHKYDLSAVTGDLRGMRVRLPH